MKLLRRKDKSGKISFFARLRNEFVLLSKPSFKGWLRMTAVTVGVSGIAAVAVSVVDLLITDVIRLFV